MFNEERLDPDLVPLAPVFANYLNLADIPAARAGLAAMLAQFPVQAPIFDDVVTHDEHVPGPKRSPDVLVRLYRPKDVKTVLPVIYYIHGGGMVLGSINENDTDCKTLVRDVGCVVVAVEYRLAPEHPYPAPLEDCYAGLKWMVEHADDLGIDPARIVVGGESAGGGLAAALCLLARDRGGPMVAMQFLVYPMLDHRTATPADVHANDVHAIGPVMPREGGASSNRDIFF